MVRRVRSFPLALDTRFASGSGAASIDEIARGPVVAAIAQAERSAWMRVRVPILVMLLAFVWIALIGWASDTPLSAAFQPSERVRLSGSDFRVVMGAGVESGRRLGINAVGAEHMALQSHALPEAIDAAAFPILRYRWEGFPRTLELSFVFRRADERDDVHTVTLPPAGAYPGYFDLSDVPDWNGRIVEIGFAEFPTAQLVPADIAFRPFSLVEAELWSPSWRGSLGALGTDWSAYRPWALMSVSALGPDAPWPHKSTPVVLLAIGLASSLLLVTLFLARTWHWLGVTLAIALAGGWIALDLRWLGEFADRHVLTRELYAGKPWRERAAIEPDTALIEGAQHARAWLARMPADTHVIVAAIAPYDILRLAYHLLPANVAPVGALTHPDATTAMKPALLVVYDDPSWTFDAAGHALGNAGVEYPADLVYAEGTLRIFALHGASR